MEEDGRLSLVFGSQIGENYQLQVSRDLSSWDFVGSVSQATDYTHRLIEPFVPEFGRERFLRAVPVE